MCVFVCVFFQLHKRKEDVLSSLPDMTSLTNDREIIALFRLERSSLENRIQHITSSLGRSVRVLTIYQIKESLDASTKLKH